MLELTNIFKLINFTTVLVFICTFTVIYFHTRRQRGVPPGPAYWPVIGNLVSFIGCGILEKFSQLRRRYGDVFGLYIGQELVTVLNGYECIHDALLKQGTTFACRPSKLDSIGVRSIVMENGERWKNHRTFVLKVFHELSFSRNSVSFENRINDELSFLVEHIETIKQPAEISRTITYSLANVMFCIIHGKRLEYGHKRFVWYLDNLENSFRSFARNKILYYCFPFLFHLPGDIFQLKYSKEIKELKEYFGTICSETAKNYEEGHEMCLIDYYIASLGDKGGVLDNVAVTEDLWTMLHDLMAAGSETTASTLKWILLFLIKQPDIQDKLRKEIDAKIEVATTPSYSSRKEFPYVEATILEAFRLGSVVPLSVPHSVTRDVIFHDYLIPKNSTVLPNLASVHMDPTLFAEPEIFRPERFLSFDGSEVVASDKVIPFSLGPRSCIGETLARMELFLYLTTLIKNFEFRNPDGQDLLSVRDILGLTRCPDKYKILVIKRQNRLRKTD